MKPGIDFTGVATPFYCNDGKGNFLLSKRSKNCRDEHGKWEMEAGRLGVGGKVQSSSELVESAKKSKEQEKIGI